jgi:hypothetical protein
LLPKDAAKAFVTGHVRRDLLAEPRVSCVDGRIQVLTAALSGGRFPAIFIHAPQGGP